MRKKYITLFKVGVIVSAVIMMALLIFVLFVSGAIVDGMKGKVDNITETIGTLKTIAAVALGVMFIGTVIAGIAYSFTATTPEKKAPYTVMMISGLFCGVIPTVCGVIGLKSSGQAETGEDKFAVFFRKILITLKYRTNIIPLLVMLVGFVAFSLKITSVSETTLYIGKSNMGLFIFASYLFSILGLVSLLYSFPKREKPKVFFVVLTFVMLALIVVMDVLYIGKVDLKLSELGSEGIAKLIADGRQSVVTNIKSARMALIINIAFEAVCFVLVALLPVIKKALMKINTRVVIEENEHIADIDLSEGDDAEAARAGGKRESA